MRLGAGALLASAADEVLVDAAVAVGAGVDEAALAVGAVQAAAQVVVVAPVALAALALGIQDEVVRIVVELRDGDPVSELSQTAETATSGAGVEGDV
jgi:hypothetical protein